MAIFKPKPVSVLVKDAPVIWNCLQGLLCVYKPAGESVHKLRKDLILKVCRELNEMDCRPPSEIVVIDGDPSKKLNVRVEPNLADHPLVVGPRYQEEDLPVSWSNYLGFHTSGVLLFGLKRGTAIAKYIRENRPTRAYRVKGLLGKATDNSFKTGKVVEKATWKFIKEHHLQKLLVAMQTSHQKKMFELCGVDLQSRLAQELAIKGLVRAADSKIPVIYGLKCVEFDPPNFTIEIQCVNEYEDYLSHLIHEIGMKLHSVAHCTGIQCIRHSYLTVDDALLPKHWTLQNILDNMGYCKKILDEKGHLTKQVNSTLVN